MRPFGPGRTWTALPSRHHDHARAPPRSPDVARTRHDPACRTGRVHRGPRPDGQRPRRTRRHLIGIDTPELGSCGARKAKRLAKRLAPKGSRIRLGNPSGVSDLDAYDRMLRYVKVGRSDIGLRQVKKGAQARYDGLDGYDEHPRQKRYRKADRKHPDHCTKTTGVDKKSYPPASTSSCPKKAPIKGNRGTDEWIYHLPGQDYYDVTHPEECFASEAGAQKHGYRKSRT